MPRKKDLFHKTDAEVLAMQDNCITRQEAAALLGWTPRTLNRHIHEIPSVKRGRHRWFLKTDVLRYKFRLD